MPAAIAKTAMTKCVKLRTREASAIEGRVTAPKNRSCFQTIGAKASTGEKPRAAST